MALAFLFAESSARSCAWGAPIVFAAITLSLVLLIAHQRPPWIVASHRFVEVSLGIAVALLAAAVWRVPGTKAV